VTLNPSRNTLPLVKHTKSIDLDHFKNTQHSLATQHQKYSRFKRDYTSSQYKLKSIQLQSYSTLLENLKLDVNVQILESTLTQLDGDQAQVDMEANHQEQEEVEAQMEDAQGGQSPSQRLTRSMFKALGARGRLFSLFVISLVEGA